MTGHPRALLLILLSAFITSGCFTSVTTIKVKPDGSGTIEQSIAMKAEAAAQLTAMESTFGDAAEKDKDKPAAGNDNATPAADSARKTCAKRLPSSARA